MYIVCYIYNHLQIHARCPNSNLEIADFLFKPLLRTCYKLPKTPPPTEHPDIGWCREKTARLHFDPKHMTFSGTPKDAQGLRVYLKGISEDGMRCHPGGPKKGCKVADFWRLFSLAP